MSVTHKLSLNELQELSWAIENLTGYLTDNSCGDPDCCGGPYYDQDQFDDASELLKKYSLEWDGVISYD